MLTACVPYIICADLDQFNILLDIEFEGEYSFVPKEIYNMVQVVGITIGLWSIKKNIIQLHNLKRVNNVRIQVANIMQIPVYGDILILDILLKLKLDEIGYGYFSKEQNLAEHKFTVIKSNLHHGLFLYVKF